MKTTLFGRTITLRRRAPASRCHPSKDSTSTTHRHNNRRHHCHSCSDGTSNSDVNPNFYPHQQPQQKTVAALTESDVTTASVESRLGQDDDSCENQCMICLEEIDMEISPEQEQRQQVQHTQQQNDDDDNDDDLHTSDRFDALPCGHVFHRKCLNQWRFAHENCPTCRHGLEFHEMFC